MYLHLYRLFQALYERKINQFYENIFFWRKIRIHVHEYNYIVNMQNWLNVINTYILRKLLDFANKLLFLIIIFKINTERMMCFFLSYVFLNSVIYLYDILICATINNFKLNKDEKTSQHFKINLKKKGNKVFI